MEIITHNRIDPELCGKAVEVSEGFSRVSLTTTQQMAADDNGLFTADSFSVRLTMRP